MMDCKKALQEANGDEQTAIDLLRKAGKKTMDKRPDRETSTGRVAIYTDMDAPVGAMIELLCESAPVANNDQFVALANDLAATGDRARPASADELLDQPSPSDGSTTLRQMFDDLNNRIREVFRLRRIIRIDAPCGGYVHHNGGVGVLLEVEGDNAELAKDICMHVAAMRPCRVGRGTQSGAGQQGAARFSLKRLARRASRRRSSIRWSRGAADLLRRALPERTAVRQGRQADGGQDGRGGWLEGRPLRSLGSRQGVARCRSKPCRPAGDTTA